MQKAMTKYSEQVDATKPIIWNNRKLMILHNTMHLHEL